MWPSNLGIKIHWEGFPEMRRAGREAGQAHRSGWSSWKVPWDLIEAGALEDALLFWIA